MIISVNWLKSFTDITMPVDELAALIGARLVEIEEVIDLGAKYKDVLIAKVVECAPLVGSDHLNVTKIDDGGVAQNVERDENGFIQVVCGAPNVREGLLVAWLPPGSTVPETYGDAEPFVLTPKNLRGVMSNGMLASARELALGDGHDGIIEVIIHDAKPGDSFAHVYELDDYLFDVENKSLTHRPDTFGVIGFAREVAAISGHTFHSPKWLQDVTPSIEIVGEPVKAPKVIVDTPEISDRYQGIILTRTKENETTNELSLMATWLARSGVRPINPIVDVTNFLMLLSGQPLHAFDYDKLLAVSGGEPVIHVRSAKEGETLALLDGRTITLSNGDIVIATDEKPIALAGAMGGIETEIDKNTTRVFLESATFNLYNLRSTQMRHGIFSEAITRFTKGQPAALTAPVLAEAVELLNDFAGLTPSSHVAEDYPGQKQNDPITVSVDTINGVLGTHMSADDTSKVLRDVECHVERADDVLTVTYPFWRADLHIPEDIIEEVGRLSGFETIAPTLPLRDFTAVRPNDFDELRATLRQILARAGANEVLSYSFVHGDILTKSGQKQEDSYRITNSISPDLQYYRQSITPSLLGLVHPNVKQGYDSFALFELNKVHPKTQGLTSENVPEELDMVALTVTNKKPQPGSPYYQAKKMVEYIGESLGLDITYEAIESVAHDSLSAPFEYRRSANVREASTGNLIGVVGEYKRSVLRAFKLPEYTAGFEIDSQGLFEAIQKLENDYSALSRYPGVERDICFQVANTISYGQISDLVAVALRDVALESVVSPVDIYQPEEAETKNITIRIKLTASDRTLTGGEVNSLIQVVADAVVSATRATIV